VENTTATEKGEEAQPLEVINNATSISPSADTTTTPELGEARIASTTDLATTSTIPPVVSAPESDLRDDPLPVTQEQAAALQEKKRERDVSDDLDLPNNTSTGPDNAPAEPALDSFDTSADQVDLIQSSSAEDQPLRPANTSNLDLNVDMPSRPVSNAPSSTQLDAEMADAPSSSTKVSHEREDDAEDQPSAKRTKLDQDESIPQFAEPDGVSHQNIKPEPSPSRVIADDGPLTQYQIKELAKALRSVKSTHDGKNFRGAAVELWPAIKELYLSKIDNPIDLSKIEQRLKAGHYKTMSDYIKDLDLLYDNCVTFNGPDHDVTKSATTVRNNLLSKIPSRDPPKVEKKKKRPPPAAPSAAHRAIPERRLSRGPHTGLAGTPATAGAAQTFAVDPNGTPLIRRDSTKTTDGGRPKREIHPPKSKDLVYAARPKKKFATELKFCENVLNEIKRPKYINLSAAFAVPVDPVALGIPDYFKIIKNPMDLSLITEKLNNGQYQSAKEFEADMRLMFRNCYKFNPPGTPVHIMGRELEAVFDAEWQRKAQYIADHTVSNAASPESSAESAEEESEEEEPEEGGLTSAASIMQARLVEEQAKLIDIMSSKKPNEVLIRMQQEMVAIVQKQVDEATAAKKAAAHPKKARAKPSKKAAPAKRDIKATKQKAYKPKHIGFAEKEQISNGIAQLEGRAMEQAIALLKKDLPDLDLEHDPELDIDNFSTTTLSKLHDLIQRYAPHVIPAPEARAPRPPKPAKPKKNKPMSKHEQEKKIDQLRQLEQQFKRQGSASDDAKHVVPCKLFPSPPPSVQDEACYGQRLIPVAVEQDQSSSGDESPSDSEED
jgi:bromodomain-containing factor 1